MRAESVGGRTWLLGAVAAWALSLWLLALFGLGDRIERLADDPSLLRRLPQAPGEQASRLGPLTQYAEIGARPLFNDDRRPQPFVINPEGEGDKADVFDFVLTSVLLTPGFQMAIVQPEGGGPSVRLKPGDAPESAPSWRLGAIKARSVVFNGPEGERTLELRVFDGSGGEPPSASPGAAPTGMAPPRLQGTRPPTPAGAPGQPAPPAPPAPPIPRSVAPSGVPAPVTPPTDAAALAAAAAAAAAVTEEDRQAEAQAEAIRQRINARRAQLKQEAQRQSAPSSSTP